MVIDRERVEEGLSEDIGAMMSFLLRIERRGLGVGGCVRLCAPLRVYVGDVGVQSGSGVRVGVVQCRRVDGQQASGLRCIRSRCVRWKSRVEWEKEEKA